MGFDYDPTRYRRNTTTTTNRNNRFLAAHPHTFPIFSSLPSLSLSTTDQELTEDDIVFTPNFSPPPIHNHPNGNGNGQTPPSSSSSSSSPSSVTNTPRHSLKSSFPDNTGILVVLPEISTTNSHPYNKTSSVATSAGSTSSSSSTRLILTIPKPPSLTPASLGHYHHQSAPVNVPVFGQRMRRRHDFVEVDLDEDEDKDGDGDDDDEEELMLQPHEIVAKSHRERVAAYSLIEGAGRTLKGRDLRQVRNAIWRQTAEHRNNELDFLSYHYNFDLATKIAVDKS